jgi:hypothetical protein
MSENSQRGDKPTPSGTISQSDISVTQEMAINLVHRGLMDLTTVFSGKLAVADHRADRELTPLGKSLASFFYLAEKEGISLHHAIDELRKMSQECGAVIYELGK